MIRAEWTKFRTVRGWVVATIFAVVVTVALGFLAAKASHTSCEPGPCAADPTGPGGEAVLDRFTFVHRALTGDGTMTARIASMDGIITYPPPGHDRIVAGLVPWAKAGIMVKDGIRPGAAYASVLLSGHHGVRMQSDFTHDVAGRLSGPVWLRLTRTGPDLTGYESADGISWHRIGSARLDGLPRTVRIGLFTTSPSDITSKPNTHGGSIVQARFTQASAVFDQVSGPGGTWRFDDVGSDGVQTDWERLHRPSGFEQRGRTLTVTGTGDIAPMGSGAGVPLEQTLTGLLYGLLLMLVVAVLFITAEYRRGLIRTTLIARPDRGRVLVAKAAVIGGVALVAGLVAAGITVPVAAHVLRAGGNHVLPVGWAVEARLIAGTGVLLGAAAVIAYAMGALLRRGVLAVTAAAGLIVVPYLLATASVLPAGAGEWLLRVTPAAGFAVQQTIPAYEQVVAPYTATEGYFPLAPWAGLGVTVLYAAALLGLAVARIRRGDA
jgi:hypothetical protein